MRAVRLLPVDGVIHLEVDAVLEVVCLEHVKPVTHELGSKLTGAQLLVVGVGKVDPLHLVSKELEVVLHGLAEHNHGNDVEADTQVGAPHFVEHVLDVLLGEHKVALVGLELFERHEDVGVLREVKDGSIGVDQALHRLLARYIAEPAARVEEDARALEDVSVLHAPLEVLDGAAADALTGVGEVEGVAQRLGRIDGHSLVARGHLRLHAPELSLGCCWGLPVGTIEERLGAPQVYLVDTAALQRV